MNLIDYVIQNGQFTMEELPFNEIDAAIFSYLTYLNWEGIDLDIESQMIPFYHLQSYIPILCNIPKFPDQFYLLIVTMLNSIRFGNVKVGFFQSILDQEVDEQFAAIVFTNEKNIFNICFRGTDTSIIGWKEDFNMLFNRHVSGQISALHYFRSLKFPYYQYRLMGHSKGANLATYCAIQCQDLSNCVGIYNFDGPGFIEEIPFEKISDIYHKYVPQCSIIGLILDSSDSFKIVESDENFLKQHDLFAWNIEENHFIKKEELDSLASFFQKSGNLWLSKASINQRKVFIEYFYELIQKENIENIHQFQFTHIQNILKGYQDFDKPTKDIIHQVIKIIIQSNLKETKIQLKKRKK